MKEHFDFTATSEIVFFRGAVQMVASLILVKVNLGRNRSRNRSLNYEALFGSSNATTAVLFARATFGYVGICGVFYALMYIPMGDSTTLLMLSTLWSGVLAIFLLGEAMSWYTVAAIPTAFAGVVLIVQPSFLFAELEAPLDLRGVVGALIGSLGAAMAYICVRKLGTSNKMYWAAVTFNQGLGQAVYSIPMLYVFGQTFVWEPRVVGCCLLLGCVGTLSQACMTIGMQREKSALTNVMVSWLGVCVCVCVCVCVRVRVCALAVRRQHSVLVPPPCSNVSSLSFFRGAPSSRLSRE